MARGKYAAVLFNPEGVQITREEWDALHAQEVDPYLIREYSNGRVHLRLRRVAILQNVRDVPKTFWKTHEVLITNIITHNAEGEELPEPRRIDDPDSKQFVDRGDAVDYYEKFLAKYTESEYDSETGKLKEVGNVLIPPDPDIPVIAEGSPVATEFGSW